MDRDDSNPYACPDSWDQPARMPFRPSWFSGEFFRLMRSCDFGLRSWEPTQPLVLREPLGCTSVFLAIALGPLVMIAAELCLQGYAGAIFWGHFCLGGIYTLFGSWCLLLGERVTLTSDGIHKKGPFLRRQQKAWRDVVSIRFGETGVMRLVFGDDSEMPIRPGLVRVVHLAQALQQWLPENVLRECAEDVATYRGFVGSPTDDCEQVANRDM